MTQPTAQSFQVGRCHHGFHAYVIITTDPRDKVVVDGRWHSGPSTERRGRGDTAETGDGIRLNRCSGSDPYA